MLIYKLKNAVSPNAKREESTLGFFPFNVFQNAGTSFLNFTRKVVVIIKQNIDVI